ncbi:hypothetical protein SAMN05444008_112116 [Cnuella takakiae]|uniref:Uncharacterized protein n=2 Tax=Cnuella takakiae TaxID=1302690 RepID=A0A1M5EN80_9BACT|nr:hypothetical protein SAMN05444008_112116 [Cnuella takakiae]
MASLMWRVPRNSCIGNYISYTGRLATGLWRLSLHPIKENVMRHGKQTWMICLMMALLLVTLLPVGIAIHAYKQPVVKTGIAGGEVANSPMPAEKGNISFDFPFVPLLN